MYFLAIFLKLLLAVSQIVCFETCFRLLYTSQLDPLTLAIQDEIDKKSGFDSDHFFYKLISYGIGSANATPQTFEWPNSIIDFVNSLESIGGQASCNLLRGPGNTQTVNEVGETFWNKINVPIPTKRTRQRRKTLATTKTGVLTDGVRNLNRIAQKSSLFVSDDNVDIRPICLSRDAMAIKPSGDVDNTSNTIIGLCQPIDIEFIKANPNPDPDLFKGKLYTEAGAIIGTTLDNYCSMLVANDFLTKSVSGYEVLETITKAVDAVQCCEECLRQVNGAIMDSQDIKCDSVCQDCLLQKDLCDAFVTVHKSIYPQLRACTRCITAGSKCHKLAVLAVTMDCESNNALAMTKMNDKEELPPHMLLTEAIPDAVHAAKKVFRASSNWWLWMEGHRINNSMLRSVRQFDETAGPKLRPLISDFTLRNRDRMDFGSILESVSPALHAAIGDLCKENGDMLTTTIFPDPFWKSKAKGVLSYITDICEGKRFNEGCSVLSFQEIPTFWLLFTLPIDIFHRALFLCFCLPIEEFHLQQTRI